MNQAMRMLFFISFVVLVATLTVPIADSAMSWYEATPGVVAGLFFCSLFGILAINYPPARVCNDPYARAVWRRRSAIRFGLLGVLTCAGLGSLVWFTCNESLASSRFEQESYRSSRDYRSYRDAAYRAPYREPSYEYAGQGRILGIAAMVTSLIPLIGMMSFLVRRPPQQQWASQPQPAPQLHRPPGA